MTKIDLYALLTYQGVLRGYEVIAEFYARLPDIEVKRKPRAGSRDENIGSRHKPGKKNIDFVWVKRKGPAEKPQNAANHKTWNLHAAFEIEGCNVSKSRIEVHRSDFQHMTAHYPNGFVPYIVLYTKAYDRQWSQRDRADEIKARVKLDQHIKVIDGSDMHAEICGTFGPSQVNPRIAR